MTTPRHGDAAAGPVGATLRALLEPILRAALDPDLTNEERARRIDGILAEWSPSEGRPVLMALPRVVPEDAGEWVRALTYFEGDPLPYRSRAWHLASIHVSHLADRTIHRLRCTRRDEIVVHKSPQPGYRGERESTATQHGKPGDDEEVCSRCRAIAEGTRKAVLD